MRLFVIAGESSGDLHGAKVVRDFLKVASNAQVQAWGGEHMEAAGAELKMGISELNIMGFSDVILKLPRLFSLINRCKQHITEFKPDLILFIDFSGFNIRIAKWAKSQQYFNHWYIAPKTWAWRETRISQLKKYIDKLYCIFPFEESYFRSHNVAAEYVGNPIVDQINHTHKASHKAKNIALLPGSRKQELDKILPIFGELIANNDQYHFTIVAVSHFSDEYYEQLLGYQAPANSEISREPTQTILSTASRAIVTSGTATLEAAIIGIPQLVIYKTSWLNYLMGKALIKTKYISLPNIICDKSIVEEYIQKDCNADAIGYWLQNFTAADATLMKKEYTALKHRLGTTKSVGRMISDSIRSRTTY